MKQHLQNAICRDKQKKGEQKACVCIPVSLKPDINCKKQGVYCGQTAETNEKQFAWFHDKWLNIIMLISNLNQKSQTLKFYNI